MFLIISCWSRKSSYKECLNECNGKNWARDTGNKPSNLSSENGREIDLPRSWHFSSKMFTFVLCHLRLRAKKHDFRAIPRCFSLPPVSSILYITVFWKEKTIQNNKTENKFDHRNRSKFEIQPQRVFFIVIFVVFVTLTLTIRLFKKLFNFRSFTEIKTHHVAVLNNRPPLTRS